MRKREAIRIIEKSIEEARALPDDYSGNWQRVKSSIICRILEPGSDEHFRIQELANVGFGSTRIGAARAIAGERARKDIEQRLTHALEIVRVHGPYKSPKPNFLSSLSSAWIGGILTLGVPALFGLGVMAGKYSSDIEKMELRREVRELKETLRVAPVTSPDQDADKESHERGNTNAKHDSTVEPIGQQ